MSDARFGLGGNYPPEPTTLDNIEALIPAADETIAKGKITDDEDAGLTAEQLEQLKKALKALKAGVPADRQPHLEAIAAIHATVAHLTEPHEKALQDIGARAAAVTPKVEIAIEKIGGSKKMVGILAAYMAAKRERLAAEAEAQRKAAEDAQREADRAEDQAIKTGTIDDELAARNAIEAAEQAKRTAGKRPPRAQVKGDLSSRATALVTYWSAEVVDWVAARKHYRTNERVKEAYDEAVQLAANDDARRLKDPKLAPAGIKFISREAAR